ncbi:Ulp1 protease family [Vigna unguiculata]|uniref:Ulp1 protease family n=1 Tax=Vigna unguiculata TaxID=3917 RepID=A0A4D6LDI6_VIGUN|nr:Ulp1 protease family [Vigna unguiculata]
MKKETYINMECKILYHTETAKDCWFIFACECTNIQPNVIHSNLEGAIHKIAIEKGVLKRQFHLLDIGIHTITKKDKPLLLGSPIVVKDLACQINVQNVEHLFWLFLNDKKQLKPTYEVHIEDVPEQPNLHDCGIMVLKYLEIWDDVKRFNGKSMSTYTDEDLQ